MREAGRPFIVAIDGPAGAGKSTVALGVARALGLHTLDTGAMYRAVTLDARAAGVDLADPAAVAALAARIDLRLEDDRVLLHGEDVTDALRAPDITAAVSTVAGHPEVRRTLVVRQRAWVEEHGGGVVEGRDIGTVVFPDAAVKVFLTADDAERARRRHRDEESAARAVAVDRVHRSLQERDDADAGLGRALRPEDAAADAWVIDTSDLPVEEVVARITAVARARLR